MGMSTCWYRKLRPVADRLSFNRCMRILRQMSDTCGDCKQSWFEGSDCTTLAFALHAVCEDEDDKGAVIVMKPEISCVLIFLLEL